MLLRFAMLTLIGTLTAGVFGFEGDLPSLPLAADWARLLFVPLLAVSVMSYTGATLNVHERLDEEMTDKIRDH